MSLCSVHARLGLRMDEWLRTEASGRESGSLGVVLVTCNPALGRRSQKGKEFKVILGFTESLSMNGIKICLKKLGERKKLCEVPLPLSGLCSQDEPRDNSVL